MTKLGKEYTLEMPVQLSILHILSKTLKIKIYEYIQIIS